MIWPEKYDPITSSELVRPVACGEVCGDGISATTGLADLRDDGFRVGPATAVVDENLGAILGGAMATGRPMPRERR